MSTAAQIALKADPEFAAEHQHVVQARHEARTKGTPEPPLPQPPRWAKDIERQTRMEIRRRELEKARQLRVEAAALRERVRLGPCPARSIRLDP